MKVYVDAIPRRQSMAMVRVMRALVLAVPDHVELVHNPVEADVQVLHAVDHKNPRSKASVTTRA